LTAKTYASYLATEIAAHPDILEVAVVARPHEKWGERPSAFVVLNQQGAKKWANSDKEFEITLKKWLRGKLPGFAIPEWVDVCKDLPVRTAGIYNSIPPADMIKRKRALGRYRRTVCVRW
jgi:acyl-CoA synthetase (AMP-forming)/AMP-acid ligase II